MPRLKFNALISSINTSTISVKKKFFDSSWFVFEKIDYDNCSTTDHYETNISTIIIKIERKRRFEWRSYCAIFLLLISSFSVSFFLFVSLSVVSAFNSNDTVTTTALMMIMTVDTTVRNKWYVDLFIFSIHNIIPTFTFQRA